MEEDMSTIIEPMEFHPCDTPRGMLYYNMSILTNEQQIKLNALKIETAREDQKYLAAHPEIRACVALLTKHVLKQRPRTNIHETIAEYFAKSRVDLESDINEYLGQREPFQREATSGLNLYPPRGSDSISYYSSSLIDEEEQEPGSFVDKLFEAEDLLGDHVMWRDESAVPSTSTLEMDLSGSLMKAAADLSEKMDTSDPSIYITASPLGKPSVTIKESLEEFGPSKSDEEGRTYTLGHIPTIEDYDAGYGKRRQTFMSDSQDKQQAHSEEVMQQYLKDVHKESSERSQEMEDVALEPARESILSEELLATLKAARVQTPDASDLKVKKSVGPHESMKALMEKRSVRISVVPPEQLQRIEDEFQKKHVQTVVKKGIKEPSDEVAAEDRPKKVSMSAGEKSGDAHALYIEANPTIQSTPNILFTVDEETEDENEIKGESADNNTAMNETVTEVTTEGDTTTEEENQTAENTTEGN